ncbi:MAG: HEAT repeat domain-containing protein, partial [Planctomycetia bacterium]|nr:HEAT repeat domain-containing protein [Planctomycetia bacterium]
THALSSAERREAVTALRKLMSDRDIRVRRSAVGALGDLKAREALPELVRALDSADALLRSSAMYSMYGIAGTSALDRDTIDALIEFASKPKMTPEGKGFGHVVVGTRWHAMALVTRYAPRDEALEMLIDQLKQPELRTRAIAIGHLVALNATEAVPEIAKLAHHAQLGLRGRALDALGALRQRQYIPMMIEQLHDQDIIGESGSTGVYGVDGWARGTKKLPLPYGIYPDSYNPRSAIIKSMRLLGATEAIPDLIRLTEAHLHPGIRMEVATLLRDWAHLDKRIVPALLRMAEDIHPQSQLTVIDWLGNIGDKRALPFIRKLLTGEFKKPSEASPFALAPMEDRTVWSAAVTALVRLDDKSIVPYLKEELAKGDDEKRKAQIVDALRQLAGDEGDKIALGIYRKQLDSKDASVQAAAAVALASLGDKSSVPKMKTLAKSFPADATRLNVLRALVQLGHREGVPALLSDIIGNRKGSHHTPLHALALARQIKAVECVPTIVKRIIEEEGMYFFRYRGAAALIELGDPAGIEALIHKKLMKGPHAYGGWVVMEGLARFKDERVVDALIEYLEDKNDLIRMRALAAQSLGRIGNPKAVPVLVNELRDEQMTGHAARVRVKAAGALVAIVKENEESAKLVIGPLVEVARGERDLSVRRAAMSALVDLRAPEATPLLVDALKDKSVAVRRAVAGALSVSTGIDYSHFAGAVKAYPNNSSQVGAVLAMVEKAQSAAPKVEVLQKAVADDPNNFDAYLQLASLYEELKMSGRAASVRRKYVAAAGAEAKPEIVSAMKNVNVAALGDEGSWWLIGPLEWSGFKAAYPPQMEIKHEAYAGKRGNVVTWKKVDIPREAGGEFRCVFDRFVTGPYQESVFFIYRTIFSKSQRRVELRFGSDDGIKVWFNGEEVISNDIYRGMARDQEKAVVTFRKDKNQMLIRINNGRYGGGFIFRITDESGKPIEIDDKGVLQ